MARPLLTVPVMAAHAHVLPEADDGVSLRHVLALRGPLPVAEAIDVALQLCAVLATPHAHGTAHLELSPASVRLVAHAGGPLGVRLLAPTRAGLPATGYAAPEQLLRGGDHDARADVFAIGALLYELVTGRPAFPADPSTFMACLHEGIPPMSVFAWAPPALEQIVFRCMSPSEVARFATATDVAVALAQLVAEERASWPVPPERLSMSGVRRREEDSGFREHWPLVVLPPIAVLLAMAIVHVVTNGLR